METTPQTKQVGNTASQNAKNFFLYFLTFVLLYMVAISLGGALFYLIDKLFPQVAQYYYGLSGGMRYHLATLIVGSPIFLWLSFTVHRDAFKDELMRHSAIRRWLTYITLIVAALIAIGDLISLVNNLLGGEVTTRFILKSLVVLAIAASVFFYYLTDIKGFKKEQQTGAAEKSPLARVYFIAIIAVVLATIGGGLMQIESPVQQRLRNEDDVRVQHLLVLQSQIEEYVNQKRTLPASLADITTVREDMKQDPVTQQPYTYRKIDELNYQLCATFVTSNKAPGEPTYGYPSADTWLHDAAETCFDRSTAYILNPGAVPVKPIPAPY